MIFTFSSNTNNKYMKKLSFLYLIVCMIILNGCVQDEPPVFDKSPSVRMRDALKDCAELLVSSPEGWFADYYPEINAKVGGYAMFFKFHANGFVDVSCEIETNVRAGKVETSQYQFTADRGPVLSFSTYNPVMHYFSEPRSSDHNGFQGDYEFVVMSTSEDAVEMKGKKYGNRITLRRNKSNVDPVTYFAQVAEMANELSEFGMFNFSLNDKRVGMVAVLDRSFSIGYKDGDQDKTVSVSYTFTPEGIRLYKPFVFDGVTMETFKWNSNQEKYVSSTPGTNAFFDVFFPEDYELRYSELIGTWNMQYHGVSTTSWSYADIEISEKRKNATYTVSAPTIWNQPIELTFDAQKGIVSILTHILGTDENTGYSVRICPYDRKAGYLYTSVGGPGGIVGIWNKDEGGVRSIHFVDNGKWVTYKANGLIIRLYDGAASKGNYTANIGGHRFNDITITKTN